MWVVSFSRVKGSMKRGWVFASGGHLCLYGIVAEKNQFRFFLVVQENVVVEEVMTQGESVAAPIKGV